MPEHRTASLSSPSFGADQTPGHIVVIAHHGKTQYQALLLAHSLLRYNPELIANLVICEPLPGPLWHTDPRMDDDIRREFKQMGADIQPFESRLFGADYPYGNKIEALAALSDGPFLFLDSDTLIGGDLSALPWATAPLTASMRRSATWPKLLPHGFSYAQIWGALYRHFGLSFEESLDKSYPPQDWRHYLYFNAGWFCGPSIAAFSARFADYARILRDTPIPELAGQTLDPWLDQVALPLTISALGGGRPKGAFNMLDEAALSYHWRRLALLYAQGPENYIDLLEDIAHQPHLRPFLQRYGAIEQMVYHGTGRRIQAFYAHRPPPPDEAVLRQELRAKGWWDLGA